MDIIIKLKLREMQSIYGMKNTFKVLSQYCAHPRLINMQFSERP